MLPPKSDDEWGFLFSEEEISKRREAAEGKFQSFTGDQIKFLRRKAKSDHFFLATGPLEYDKGTIQLHGHYSRWLEATRGQQYRATLFPRDHYKTTWNTVTDSIQMALPNEAGLVEHPYCLGPNIKLLLAHETREMASRFLYSITAAFTAKPLMLALFPDLIPSARVQRMNKWELDLPRTEHHIEPTFDTIGAGGAAQGRHFNWLKLDDLVGEDARDSITVMQRVLTWFDNVTSLLTLPKIDGWDLTGTHWSLSDVYSHAFKVYGVNKSMSFVRNYFPSDYERLREGYICLYGRSVEENGEIIFPELVSEKQLAIWRQNPRVYAAQYANNPKDTTLTSFQPSWLKFYNVGTNDRLIVFTGDTSYSVSSGELDRVILVDPSVGESDKSDETGIVVTGTDKKLNIYVLEAFKKRLKPPELIDELFRLYTKWWPRVISIEDVAFQAMLKYWFEEKCRQAGVYPNIYPYKPGSKRSKEARISSLGNYGSAGQIYCLEGMNQLRNEWEWFPLGDSEHILDAFAQGPEVWSRGVAGAIVDGEKAVEHIYAERDELTGY